MNQPIGILSSGRRWWQAGYAAAAFYPTLAWNVLLGRVLCIRNWWDFIDDHVIVGARPLASDLPALSQLGVRGIVNTCEEFAGFADEYLELGIEQFHMPTTDFCHPSLRDVQRSVAFVQRHVDAGHVVYIHCKAGRARSATVAMCWLIAHRDMDADTAQSWLLEKRPHINPRLTRRPVVQQFTAGLQSAPT
ncbi:MAG: dual specificity protein phosphatase family protein [Planctomycetota bacterium]